MDGFIYSVGQSLWFQLGLVALLLILAVAMFREYLR